MGIPFRYRFWWATKRFLATGATTFGATFVVTGSWTKSAVAGVAAGIAGGGEKYAKETAKSKGVQWTGVIEAVLKLIVKLVQAWREERKK